MNARDCHSPLAVHALDGRSLLSTVAYGDFNNDGRSDMATLTKPTTIVVRLAKVDGSYTVSASLTAPKNRPASEIYVGDHNGDGKLDLNALGVSNSGSWITHRWLGNGDGTFGSRTTDTFRFGHIGHGGTWRRLLSPETQHSALFTLNVTPPP